MHGGSFSATKVIDHQQPKKEEKKEEKKKRTKLNRNQLAIICIKKKK
jgi:hypothetical protein